MKRKLELEIKLEELELLHDAYSWRVENRKGEESDYADYKLHETTLEIMKIEEELEQIDNE